MRAFLKEADAPVLGYCRSGTRAVTLWALAEAGALPGGEIVKAAARAGVDLSALASRLSAPAA
jgi:sulfide:quinone oxidoreductase